MKLQLTAKQNEFIQKATHRYNIKVGAVRSGKSYGDMAYVIPSRIRERAGMDGLNFIIGVSTQTIERNVLQPMREIYTDVLIGNIHAHTNIAQICGEPVYCIGAEKASQVSKLQGASVKYAYGDEIAKWNKEVFEMLKSRLDKEYSCMDGSLNPESPNHWLKKFIDDPEIDMYTQHYTIFDNPFLPKQFVKNLCKEYEGTVYYKRYIEGLWAQAEGLIFPNYLNAIGDCPYVLSVDSFTTMDDFCLSIDYGTLNAFAAILWVKVGATWWAWRGYYYSGRDTGVQKTDFEYADDVCQLVEPVFAVQKKKAETTYGIIPDKILTIIDPSAASFITEMNKRGIFRTLHADNNVEDGLRNTNTAIQHDIIKIDRSLKEWEDEAAGYVWDKVKGSDEYKEAPVKVNDHCLTGDTLIMTEEGNKPIKDLVGSTGRVWSFNTDTGKAELKPYHDCRLTQKKAKILKITLKDGRVIRCTEEHPILTKRGYILAKYLTQSDEIIDITVNATGIGRIEFDGYEDVYNMEVDDNHNFAVEGGLIVHNCMDATRYFVRTKKLGRIKLVEDGQYEQLLLSQGTMGAGALLGYF